MSDYEALPVDVRGLGNVEVDCAITGRYCYATWEDPGDAPEVVIYCVYGENERGEMVELSDKVWLFYWEDLVNAVLMVVSE